MPNPLVLLRSKFFLFSLIFLCLPLIYLLLKWLIPIIMKLKKKEDKVYNEFTEDLNDENQPPSYYFNTDIPKSTDEPNKTKQKTRRRSKTKNN